ncbi:Bax inhibitor-1/YccA family protein [Marinimicrobium alkaliphilum]|uniref:Bax inhibitor-1/YccA family protein n=1 Tax=Marinimicrobium alkaliphilum TaxID=2202654 RepID=UPI000DB970A1|nr:Bax inhibitor-1/YccA family protein [Marinimicrobium alkaliphilum]
MQELYNTQSATSEQQLAVSRVLRNTYMLLAMTLAFSAVTAGAAMAMNVGFLGLWMLLPYFVCLFMVEKTKNSTAGLFWVFALTGWLGFSIGPMINYVAANAGYEPIIMALGGTALIFFAMSGYVLTTRKDLSFMGGFLTIGILVAFIAAIANYFFQIQGMSLAISSMFLLLGSAIIAWQTSAIIHGGERNYISATVTLFVMLYNIFSSLLHLIMSFSRD